MQVRDNASPRGRFEGSARASFPNRTGVELSYPGTTMGGYVGAEEYVAPKKGDVYRTRALGSKCPFCGKGMASESSCGPARGWRTYKGAYRSRRTMAAA